MTGSNHTNRARPLRVRLFRGLAVLGVVAVALGGCRSDGGVGRRDAQRSLTRTLEMIGENYDRDVANTNANIAGFSDWWDRQFSQPWDGVTRTVNLYLEGHPDR